MNQLPGIIKEIISEGHLSIVRISALGNIFSAIVIDTPATAPYLKEGGPVNMLFKENEVAIVKSFSGLISLQNRFEGTVKELEQGKLLCKVIVDYKGVTITSIITTNAAKQLNLTIGDQVTAMVKTNEMSLSPHD